MPSNLALAPASLLPAEKEQDKLSALYVVRAQAGPPDFAQLMCTLHVQGQCTAVMHNQAYTPYLYPHSQLIPCLVLAFLAHPSTSHNFFFRVGGMMGWMGSCMRGGDGVTLCIARSWCFLPCLFTSP